MLKLLFHPLLLTPLPASVQDHHQLQTPIGFERWQDVHEASSISWHFSPLYSRRFVWKYNDNKSSRFERVSQEMRKDRCTQTYSWKRCQQQLGKWQDLKWVTTPLSADRNLKVQQFHLIYFWLPRFPFIYQGEGSSWLASDDSPPIGELFRAFQ